VGPRALSVTLGTCARATDTLERTRVWRSCECIPMPCHVSAMACLFRWLTSLLYVCLALRPQAAPKPSGGVSAITKTNFAYGYHGTHQSTRLE